MKCDSATRRPALTLQSLRIRHKLVEGLAPAFLESHFLVLPPASFVFVDHERGVLGSFLMPFKEKNRRKQERITGSGIVGGR